MLEALLRLDLPSVGWLPLAFIAYLFISRIASGIHNNLQARALRCSPAPLLKRKYWWDFLSLWQVRELGRINSRRQLPQHFFKRYEDMSKLHGYDCATFKVGVLGRQVTFTSDPRNVQAILATQFKDFNLGKNRKGNFDPLLGKGIFTSDGKEWEHSRALLRPSFARDQVSDLDLEEKHCQNLMRALDVKSDGWTSDTDLQVLFFRLTIDSSTEFLFGKSVNSQINEMDRTIDPSKVDIRNEATFAGAFDKAQAFIAARGRLGDNYWIYNTKEFREACRLCHEFIDHYVQLALSKNLRPTGDPEKGEKYVFLEELARRIRDPIALRSQLLHILLAGRDTTASLLGWTFYLLANHPSVFEKLRTVIIKDFGNYDPLSRGEITFAKLKGCQYLQHVLNESLRLFPVVPLNGRQAIKDTTLPVGGGADGTQPIFIPQGTNVSYSVYVMHRRPILWGKDADEFKPERWQQRRPGWEFLPFNGGPRICLGQQFALTSASFAVVRLLQRFDRLESLDPHGMKDVRHNATLTDCSDRGVRVRLHEALAT